ncbi:MAG TPA: histidine--tRNA ligase, partial [Vicinamibacterales bacterium]
MISTKPPSGTRDFLPDDVRKRQYVTGVIRDVFEQYGYEPLETPAFENIETLLGKYGDEGNKLIFKILKRGEHEHTGEADLALRYDLTVPLARVVAQYQNELPKFFKRYQIQPVWRADRPAKGRFREFYQCDLDSIGSTSPIVDAEVLAAICDVLTRLGFEDFTLRLNHRGILAGLLAVAGVRPDLHSGALVALDKLDKVGIDGVQKELVSRGIDSAAASTCLKLFDSPVGESPADAVDRLERALGAHDAVGNLRAIVSASARTTAGDRIRIDSSLARGLSYYTGAIMEIAVADLQGSLGGGGRYDGLIGMFLGRDVPACGFSLGLERMLVVMSERNMFPTTVAGGAVDIMVTVWNADRMADAIALAADLRRGGLRVEVYPEPDKLGKQFKHASSRNVPFVAIEGDDERIA